VVNHSIYDVFGRATSESNPTQEGALLFEGGPLLVRNSLFLFTARPCDSDTQLQRPFDSYAQLQNNLNRWYDGRVGRWLSEDPIGFSGGDANLYRYVGNSPTVSTDAAGLSSRVSITHSYTFRLNFDEYFISQVPISSATGSLRHQQWDVARITGELFGWYDELECGNRVFRLVGFKWLDRHFDDPFGWFSTWDIGGDVDVSVGSPYCVHTARGCDQCVEAEETIRVALGSNARMTFRPGLNYSIGGVGVNVQGGIYTQMQKVLTSVTVGVHYKLCTDGSGWAKSVQRAEYWDVGFPPVTQVFVEMYRWEVAE
jgi:RHS repeat-associated protein